MAWQQRFEVHYGEGEGSGVEDLFLYLAYVFILGLYVRVTVLER